MNYGSAPAQSIDSQATGRLRRKFHDQSCWREVFDNFGSGKAVVRFLWQEPTQENPSMEAGGDQGLLVDYERFVGASI